MRKTLMLLRAGIVLASLAQLANAGAARAVPLNAGDLVPAPAGTTGVFTYYTYTADGSADCTDKTVYTGDAKRRSQFVVIRPYHFFDIFGVRSAFNALVPVGTFYDETLNHQDLAAVSGFGSTILALGLWPINQPQQQRYVTLVPFLWIPNGQYDPNKPVNVGDNRWKGALQLGFHQGFGAFSFELAADVTVYGDNTDFGPAHQRLSTTTAYELQAWLRYDYSKNFHYEVGFSQTLGGQESIDGIEDGWRTQRSRVRLEAGYQITSKIEIMNELARDVAVTGDFKADFVNMTRINVGF